MGAPLSRTAFNFQNGLRNSEWRMPAIFIATKKSFSEAFRIARDYSDLFKRKAKSSPVILLQNDRNLLYRAVYQGLSHIVALASRLEDSDI